MSVKPAYRKAVAQARQWLLENLREQAGFTKLPAMLVCAKPRGVYDLDYDTLGYHKQFSQFKGLLHIGAIPDEIMDAVKGNTTDFHIELRLTLAHEFAHSMAEAMDHYFELMDTPSWKEAYVDEEDFAEDFAKCLVGGEIRTYPFWDYYLTKVVAIYNEMVEN